MDVNAYNALQAQKQMAFQERMSNTAHQREVADLQKAGLNPVLSAGGSGASTPTGALSQADPDSFNSASAVRGLVKEINKGHQDLIQAVGQMYNGRTSRDGRDIGLVPGFDLGLSPTKATNLLAKAFDVQRTIGEAFELPKNVGRDLFKLVLGNNGKASALYNIIDAREQQKKDTYNYNGLMAVTALAAAAQAVKDKINSVTSGKVAQQIAKANAYMK